MQPGLWAFAVRRILFLIPLLIGLTLVMFLLIHIAPGDPVTAMLSPQAVANPAYLEQARQNLGLDQPLPIQYLKWLGNVVQGDLGTAYSFNNKPVLSLIGERLGATVELQGDLLLIGIIIAVPVGILSATRQYSMLDNSVTIGSFIGLALPNFWLALLLQFWLGVKLGWVKTSSAGISDASFANQWKYWLLPVIVLTLPNIAYFARFMRSSMLEVIHQDYMTTARAKGLDNRSALYGHALRNALIPMVTVIGLQLPRILGGAVIIETIFAWPGIGMLAWTAIGKRDYPVILGITLLTGAAIMVVNVLVDIIYALVDPRVSVGGSEVAIERRLTIHDGIGAGLGARYRLAAPRKRFPVVARFMENKLAVVGLIVIVLFYLIAFAAPLLANHPYDQITFGNRTKPPSAEFWMGTDRSGRDVYSRLLKGGQISLAAGFASVVIVMTIGTLLGALAGFFGGLVDAFLMRFTDILLAIPLILLLITAASLFRPSLKTTIIVIGVSSWPGAARLVRGQFMQLKGQEFVTAARAMGASPWRLMLKHLFPNALAIIIVETTLWLSYAILLEASLSYLGLGVQIPTPSWGNMLQEGQSELLYGAWWLTLFPGLAIFITVLAFNLMGDGLRDALDPRHRRR